jgi:hypothetical protein
MHILDEMLLLNLRTLNREHAVTTITFFMEEKPLFNFRTARQVCLIVMSDREKMPVPNSRRMNH